MDTPNSRLAARRQQKKALLPEAARLARQGRTCRQIAKKLGISKTTVSDWLRGRRVAAAARWLGTPQGAARLATCFQSIYGMALREWHSSRGDKEVRPVETTSAAGGEEAPKKKESLRSENRTANAAYLSRALGALQGLVRIHGMEATRYDDLTVPGEALLPAESLTPEDMASMTDEQLHAWDVRLAAEGRAAGEADALPVLTREELHALTPAQRSALKARCLAEIEWARQQRAAVQKDEGGTGEGEGGRMRDEG